MVESYKFCENTFNLWKKIIKTLRLCAFASENKYGKLALSQNHVQKTHLQN